MASKRTKIFLCYRRRDTSSDARNLRRELERSFAADEIFRDIEGIELSEDLLNVINDQIQRAHVVIVLIGPNWLLSDSSGERRIDHPDDPIRFEIKTALSLQKKIIPVYVRGTPRLTSDNLPEDIRKLADLNAHWISDETFDQDLRKLVLALPGSEVSFGSLVGMAAFGGFVYDIAAVLLRNAVAEPGGFRGYGSGDSLLPYPILAGVRWGTIAWFILTALRHPLRISSERVAAASAWIALAAFSSDFLTALPRLLNLVPEGPFHDSVIAVWGHASSFAFAVSEAICIGGGGICIFLWCRGESRPPFLQMLRPLVICSLIGAGINLGIRTLLPRNQYQMLFPDALSAAIYRTQLIVGVLWATGGIRAWGQSFIVRLSVAAACGLFTGSVLAAFYRWVVYQGRDVPGDALLPIQVFMYGALVSAIYLAAAKSRFEHAFSPPPRLLRRSALIILICCLTLSFFINRSRFRESALAEFQGRVRSAFDEIIDKMVEKGVLKVDEANNLRPRF